LAADAAGHDLAPARLAIDVSATTLESFADVSAWTARRADGSASTAVAITGAGAPRGPWRATPTARITAGTGALDDRLERTGPAVDLRPFTDLVLWVRADRPADGSPERPFFAEVRLGSSALAPGANGNDWHRFIDIATPGTWQQVPLALGDLAPQVRQGVTTVRLTCVDATTAWALDLDRIIAVREELLADTDAAVRARLHNRLQLGGTSVPAVLAPTASTPAAPHFRLGNYDVRPDLGRSPGAQRRTDHTRSGFALRPPSEPFTVYYALEAVTDERAQAAALLDFAVAEFVPTATIESGARVVTVDWVDAPLWTPPPGTAAVPTLPPAASLERPVLHLRVSTGRSPAGAAEPAVPVFNVVDVEVEQRV
jgi:hypothetical protein